MRPVFTILSLYWTEHKNRFFWGFALAVITLIAAVALLGVSGWFITASAVAGLSGAALALDYYTPSASIRGLAIARTLGRYGERLTTHDATLAFLVAVRRRLFDAFSGLEFADLGRLRSGEVLARITADVDSLDAIYLRLFVPIAGTALILVLTGAVLLLFAPGLVAGVFFILIAGFVAVTGAGLMWGRGAGRHEALAREAVRVRLIDLTRGLVELHLAGRLATQGEAVLGADAAETVAARKRTLVEMATSQSLFIVTHVALGLALFAGAQLVAGGALDPAILALIVIAILGLGEALGGVVRGVSEFGRTELAARRLAPRLKASVERDVQRPQAAPEGALLEAKGLSIGWTAPVVEGLDITVTEGQHVALTGASGVGKSTLLASLAGLIDPLAGTISIAETGAVAARIAYVPQKSALFADTIAANLLIAAPDARPDDLWAALEQAQLADFVRELPQGLDTPLGEGGKGLSGGQARRLAIARASLLRPDLFLLDEPTEGLAPGQGEAVLKGLFAAFPKAGFVVATHREGEAALFDMAIDLDARTGQSPS